MHNDPVKASLHKGLFCSVLAALLVLARTADAHVHYCFDGKEPPVSVHFADNESHPCETRVGSGHSGDQDVQIASDAVVKKAAADDAWLPAMHRVGVEFIPQPFLEPVLGCSQLRMAGPAFFLRPPLRGPPR